MSSHRRTPGTPSTSAWVQHSPTRTPPMPVLPPINMRKERVGETENVGEDLIDLHQQLQKETENIVRWKAATEIKNKNLERQQIEAQAMVEDQRKKMMDLQLQLEHLSQTVVHKHQERDMILAQVIHTQEMFLSLKEEHEHLSQTISHFQEIKDSLVAECNDDSTHLTQYQEDVKAYMATVRCLTAQAEEKAQTLEKLKEDYLKQLSTKDRNLGDCSKRVATLRSELETQVVEHNITASELAAGNQQCNALEHQLKERNEAVDMAQRKMLEVICSFTSRRETAEEKLKAVKERLLESRAEFHEAAEKILAIKRTKYMLEGANSEFSEKVAALTAHMHDLEKVIMERRKAKASHEAYQSDLLHEENLAQQRIREISSQLAVLEPKCKDMKVERNKLLSEFAECQNSLNVKREHKQLKEQVSGVQSEILALEENLSQLKEEHSIKEQYSRSLQCIADSLSQEVQASQAAVREVCDQLSETEQHNIQLKEQLASLETTVEKSKQDVELQTEKNKIMSQEMRNEKITIRKLEKEVRSKSRIEKNKIKARIKLAEKVATLEEELNAQRDHLTTLEDELRVKEKQLEDKNENLKDCQINLDESLCAQQNLQRVVSSKDIELTTAKTVNQEDLETLKAELIEKEQILLQTHEAHKQEVSHLYEEFQCDGESEQVSTLQEEHQKVLDELKKRKGAAKSKVKQLKDKVEAAAKESFSTKLDSDMKVKELVSLLEKFKTEKETKLKGMEQQLQKNQGQIAQLTTDEMSLQAEADSLRDEIARAKKPESSKNPVSCESDKSKTDIPVPSTPSPHTYLPALNIFVDTKIPQMPLTIQERLKSADEPQVAGILKAGGGGKRTLLPTNSQKQVVFKVPSSSKDVLSDSSSDAQAMEILDSDDPFEVVKRSGWSSTASRTAGIPRANITPFITTAVTLTSDNTSTTSVTSLATHPYSCNQSEIYTSHGARQMTKHQQDKSYHKSRTNKKKVRINPVPQMKTYSSISPRFSRMTKN